MAGSVSCILNETLCVEFQLGPTNPAGWLGRKGSSRLEGFDMSVICLPINVERAAQQQLAAASFILKVEISEDKLVQ